MQPVRAPRRRPPRSGAILTMLAVMLPMLIAVVALVFDGGLMMSECRRLQHATDAAATAAAMDVRLGKGTTAATSTGRHFVQNANGLPAAEATVHIPPTSGPFAGQAGYVEVVAELPYAPRFMALVDQIATRTLRTRSVAGVSNVTAGAAVVVLDPHPSPLTISPLPALPPLPALIAGLEVEGLGKFSVDGAVLVNNKWGGVDENGRPAGSSSGPPYAVACTPILPLTRLAARDIRVAGGVDDPDNYSSFSSGQGSPLRANRLPVPDPYGSLPVPTTASDPVNVSVEYRGPKLVVGLPLIGPPVTLQPGVYDYIHVISGVANFEPGVYIIRGVEPTTGIALNLLAGTVNARGVLFYITNSPGYDGVTGMPDASDGETPPAAPGIGTIIPSVVIQAALLGTGVTGLNSPGSPFHGMVIYQRRQDRRPIVIAHQNLLPGGDFSGTVYAKWAHVAFVGNGAYDARFVCGTMRVVTLFNSTISPSQLLPPAQDVLLVE